MADKARTLVRVNESSLTVMTDYGRELTVYFDEAPRPELIQACQQTFNETRKWLSYTKEELVKALETRTIPPVKEIQPRNPGALATLKQIAYLKALYRQLGNYNWQPPHDLTMGAAAALIATLKRRIEGEADSDSKLPETGTTFNDETPTPTPTDNRPGVDMDAIRDLVNAIVRPVDQDVKAVAVDVSTLTSRVSAVASLIADLQPQIHHIHIDKVTVKELEGRQHSTFGRIVELLNIGTHVYLAGPPGTGKSTMAENIAKALGYSFHPIACHPTMQLHECFGFVDGNGNAHDTELTLGIKQGKAIVLLDEIDKCHPGVLSGLNAMLANGWAKFGTTTIRIAPETRFIVTGNTFGTGKVKGHESANKLDVATLDRFMGIWVDYDEALETDMAMAYGDKDGLTTKWLAYVRKLRAAAKALDMADVLFTPRASKDGANALNNTSLSWEEIVDARLRKGISEDNWMALNRHTNKEDGGW